MCPFCTEFICVLYMIAHDLHFSVYSITELDFRCRMASSGMLCSVALLRIDVSEKLSVSFIRVTLMEEALNSS
jgi:uncharacterized membrane protein YwaF